MNLRFEPLEERLALSTLGDALSGLTDLKNWARDVVANNPHEKPFLCSEVGLSKSGLTRGIGVAIDAADLAGLTGDAAEGFTTVWIYGYGNIGGSVSVLGALLEAAQVPLDADEYRTTLDIDFQSDPNLSAGDLLQMSWLPSLDHSLLTTSVSASIANGKFQLLKFEANTDLVAAGTVDSTGTQGLLRTLLPGMGTLGNLINLPDAVSSLVSGVGFRMDPNEANESNSSPMCDVPAISEAQDFIGYVSADRITSFYDIAPSSSGNLIVSVSVIDDAFQGFLTLLDSHGNVAAFGKSSGTSLLAAISNAVAGEHYTAQISGYGDRPGSITIRWEQPTSLLPDPADNTPAPRVFHDAAGGAFANARFVAVDKSNKGDDAGKISPKDDVDFYCFTANATGRVEIDIAPQDGLTTFVTLYDGQKNAVDTSASDNDDGYSYFLYNVVAGKTYYIGISSKDHSSTGGYELHIRPFDPNSAPGQSGTDSPPAPLPGWGGVIGAVINVSRSGSGSSTWTIGDPGETRWVQIDGSLGPYTEVLVTGSDGLVPSITAYRADGSPIDSDSAYGQSPATAHVCFRVNAGERIILAVRSDGGRSTGSFQVQVNRKDNDSYTPSTPWLSDAGNGYVEGRITTDKPEDVYQIPVKHKGWVIFEIDPATDSTLVAFLKHNYDGGDTDSASDDGRARLAVFATSDSDVVTIRVSGENGTTGPCKLTVFHTDNKDDDYPDSGGPYIPAERLGSTGPVVIQGRINDPSDIDAFRVMLADGLSAGPVIVEVVSQTEGFRPFIASDTDTLSYTDGGGEGRGYRAFTLIPSVLTAPDHWVNIKIKTSPDGCLTTFGDYTLYVWRPGATTDRDPDWIGPESSLILLDGTGNGSLPAAPGGPNQGDDSPRLDFAGDKDVFQVQAVAPRPITFTVTGQDTFLRIYDSSGNAVATDHGSGPGGVSQVTLEADRGQLFYIEVAAFNGTDQGAYTVKVSQPTDDHPDAPIFDPKKGQQIDGAPITLDASGSGQATGQIEASLVGDRDVFQVTAAQRGLFTVNVMTTDNTLDSFLRVYDSRGNLVAIDDDGGDGRNSRTTFTASMDEIYQIEVSGYNDNSVGAYQVTASGNFAISDPVLFTIPSKTTTTTGVYDDFTDNALDAAKWSTGQAGQATIAETVGQLRLTATGAGASSDDNHVTVQSLGIVQGNVEFDLTPTLGHDNNSAFSEVTDGTNYIRVALNSDGAGGILLGVQSNGYTQLENAGFQAVTAGTNYHIAVTQATDGISVYRDGTRIARFAGELRINSQLRSGVASAASPSHYQLGLYDDFSDNSIDGAKWAITQDSGGQGVAETDGRMILYGTAGGSARTQNVYSTGSSTGVGIRGASWTQAYLDGGMDGMYHSAEISNGTDYIRISCESNWQSFLIQVGGSYGSGTVKNVSGASHAIDIKEVGSDIQILFDGSVQYTIVGKSIAANSYFHAFASSTNDGDGDHRMAIDNVSFYHITAPTGQDRSAGLLLDNVQGTFQNTTNAVQQAYDTFDDNQIDYGNWHVAGTVDEQGGSLKLPLYRGGVAMSGFVSTAGMPGGMNLRGFRLGASRTAEPKRIGATDGHNFDTWARIRLTNGIDWIEVGWNLRSNTFKVETQGAYAAAYPNRHHTEEFSVPAGQIVDGGFEVRERNGNIEILHDGNIKVSLSGQTVRAGSFFTFESNGSPLNGGTPYDPPSDFEVMIDNLWFYVDPVQPDLNPTPALKQTSDSGASNSDSVTNQLSLDFEWSKGTPETRYQWREGELLTDGTIAYGTWSSPQAATTAHVDLPHGSIHLFSVRPIDTLGGVGEASSRAITVDTVAPGVTINQAINQADPAYAGPIHFTVVFSESVSDFAAADVHLAGTAGATTATITDSGDHATYDVAVSGMTGNGTLIVTVAAAVVQDAAGNANTASTSTDNAVMYCMNGTATPGLYDPTSSWFHLRDTNSTGPDDHLFGYGEPGGGWTVLVGDWNGDGATGVGLYAPESSSFYLSNAYQTGFAEYTFGYGEAGGGWIPLVGDWDGDGKAGVGLYNPKGSTFYLTNTLQTGFAEYTFGYGEAGGGWTPLVGDWNGDGHTGVGLYNPHASTFYLTNTLQTGFAEYTFGYGEPNAGWQPMVGDWNGDRSDGVGLFAPQSSTFYLTNAFVSGFAQHTFGYGEPNAGWKPLVGDWNGNGVTGVGLYAPSSSTFYLTDTLSSGYAEYTIGFGLPNAGWQPLVGCWGPAPSVSQSAGLAVQSPTTTTVTPAAEAVDQIDLADIAREASGSTTLTDLDIPLVDTLPAKGVSERATDVALQGL